MSRTLFTRKFTLALLFMLMLAIGSAAPAMAASDQGGGQFCAGNNYTLASGQSTDSLLAIGCNVTIEQGATIHNDLANFGGNVTVAGTVGGDITTFGGNVTLADSAVINGGITSMGGNVQRASGAQVSGGISNSGGNIPLAPPIAPLAPLQPAPPTSFNPFAGIFNFGFDILGGIVTALAFAALGALVVIIAPNATRRVSDAVETRPWHSAGVGCLTPIVLVLLSILLFIILIGILVIPFLIIAAAFAWILGWIGIGFLIGERILKALGTRDVLPVVAVCAGIIAVTIALRLPFAILGEIPFVGWIFSILGWLIICLIGLVGLGAVVLTRFGTRAYPTPPTMMMTPAVAAAAPGAPGTYPPSTVDVAAWEERAKQAQAREATPPAAETKSVDIPPAENTPPNDANETKPNE